MKCVILRQDVPPDAPPDEQDVLSEAASVAAALRCLGWRAEEQAVSLDLGSVTERLRREAPDLVFNLVESLDSCGPLCAAVPALLRRLALRFTGNGAAALALTADKPATRRALRQAGVSVPPGSEDGWPGRFIVKHASEHASIGLGPHSVVPRLSELPPACYAEAFIDGREFNVSMLADGKGGCTILPIAELVYSEDWPADVPRILHYAAKWDRSHPLYSLTRSRFGDAGELASVARGVWRALGLEGYARVDLRVDADGVPYVVDVNANPCLGEDAGFAAAAAKAGIDYTSLIGQIANLAAATVSQRAAARLSPGIHGADARERLGLHSGTTGRHDLRGHLVPADLARIAALCRGTGFFSEAEIGIAEELATERLARGDASNYRFLTVDAPDRPVLAYACYGPIAGTEGAWDLYWIVVDRAAQGAGLGSWLLDAVLADAAAHGGTRLYAETEGTPLYAPTRAFYAARGFKLQAVLPDFYAPDVGKQVWMRTVRRTGL